MVFIFRQLKPSYQGNGLPQHLYACVYSVCKERVWGTLRKKTTTYMEFTFKYFSVAGFEATDLDSQHENISCFLRRSST